MQILIFLFDSPYSTWESIGCAWIFLFLFCICVGWTENRGAKGSVWRLVWVSAFLGVIGSLPAACISLFLIWGTVEVSQLSIARLSTFSCLIYFTKCLTPPMNLRGTKEKLPTVTDQSFLHRVGAIAEKMQIDMPLVRRWPSIDGNQRMNACVGMLQAPQLLVSDGTIHRLNADECDAIIAHELAHIANGSLFLSAAIFPVSGAVATAAAHVLSIWVAVPFWMAYYVGLKRIVSRPVEFDCDHRAALALGFRTMSSALSKIHAAHILSNSGLLSLMVYATATHPPRDARLAALYHAAPTHDRPTVSSDNVLTRWHRVVTYCAVIIWGVVLSGILVAAAFGYDSNWFGLILTMIAIAPLSLIQLSIRKQILIARRRIGTPRGWMSFLGFIALIAIGVVVLLIYLVALMFSLKALMDAHRVFPALITFVVLAAIGMGASVAAFLFLRSKIRNHQAQLDVLIAFQKHDFLRAVELCAMAPPSAQRLPAMRYYEAIALAICEDPTIAIGKLEQLWKDHPTFQLAPIAIGVLVMNADLADRAVEVARQLGSQLPGDPVPLFLEARGLRRLRRLDEASVACDRARLLFPENGSILAIAAAIELDQGQIEQAKTLITQALDFAPGDSYLLIVRAEIAIRSESREQAASALELAGKSVQSNPLVFLNGELNRVETLLNSMDEAALAIEAP